jgi:hypothetical protein
VVRVDDGSTGGDVIVIADVPLRHVDEVKIAEASRRIGHAGEAKIRAVGEHRRQQRRFVGGGIAGAQMHEPIGESGPPIDIALVTSGRPTEVNVTMPQAACPQR